THAQLIRQLGSGEIEADAAALLLHIDTDARIGEVDDDVAFTLIATLEVQASDGARTGHRCRAGYRWLIGTAPVTGAGLGRHGSCRSCGITRSLAGTDHHVEAVALGAGCVG